MNALPCCCARRGIEEYDEREMLHYGTAIVPIESADRLTPNILKRVEQKFDPDRIIVEYNACGSWTTCSPPSRRAGAVPDRDHGGRFHPLKLYSNNMGPMMFEHITTADLVVFNRCTDALKEMQYQKNIRAMNPRATFIWTMWTAIPRTITAICRCRSMWKRM